MSKPHQDRQERWQELRWASQIHWCLSGRLAHLGTRCDHATGLASSSLGKSQWQGYPPRRNKQTCDLAQNWRNGTTCPVMSCNRTHFDYFFSCFSFLSNQYLQLGWICYPWQLEISPFPISYSYSGDIDDTKTDSLRSSSSFILSSDTVSKHFSKVL